MPANSLIQCKQLLAGDLPLSDQLEPLELDVTAGEIISIIGPNYATNSAWLRTLCGLQDPLAGKVFIHGVDTSHLSAQEWTMTRMKVAYVHADTALMSAANGLMNVLAPALYHQLDKKPGKELLVEQALDLLEQIDPQLNLDDLPAYLSREQQFKIAVARSLLLQPDVLALDDPFTHFDSDTKQQFQLFLQKQVSNGLALLLTTHDIPYAINHSDRIIFALPDKFYSFDSKQALLNSNIASIKEYIKINA